MAKISLRLAAVSAAALALYVPAFGVIGSPRTCRSTAATATAAPSPTCGSDLRECLRMSADMRQTTFGGRFVTAEDVARCTEIFNGCIHGGAGAGGTPIPSTTSTGGGGGRRGLPQHFGMNYQGALIGDCRINGDAVTCKSLNPNGLAEGQDSWTGTITGTLSGMTMTGQQTFRIEGHYSGEPGCSYTEEGSGTITLVFDSSGTVSIRSGPLPWHKTNHGSCSGGSSETIPPNEVTASWSALG